MSKATGAGLALSTAGVVVLGGLHLAQARELDALRAEVAALQPTAAASPTSTRARGDDRGPDRYRGFEVDADAPAGARAGLAENARADLKRAIARELASADDDGAVSGKALLADALDAAEDDPVHQKLRAAVRDELHRAEEEERAERRQRRRDRVETNLREFAEDNGLSEKETEGLVTAVTLEQSQARDIFRSARRGEIPFSEVRAQIGPLREATNEAAKGLLDDDAYAAFIEMREEEAERFARWGGGRRQAPAAKD